MKEFVQLLYEYPFTCLLAFIGLLIVIERVGDYCVHILRAARGK